MQQLTYPKVLILDELGYLPMNRAEASPYFRLMHTPTEFNSKENRCENKKLLTQREHLS